MPKLKTQIMIFTVLIALFASNATAENKTTVKESVGDQEAIKEVINITNQEYDGEEFYHVEVEKDNGSQTTQIYNEELVKVEQQPKISIASIIREIIHGAERSINRIIEIMMLK